MTEQGRISEDVFNNLGFPLDKDVNGHEVLRAQVYHRKAISGQNVLLMNFKLTFGKNASSKLKIVRDARQNNFKKSVMRKYILLD